LEFEVGDHVYLRVLPMKGVKRFEVKGKLAPHYIGPFPILEKCGTVVYKLDLPPSLAPMDVVLPEVTPFKADLSYPEHPIKILDQKDRVTRRTTIKFFKIQCRNHTEEGTWKSEDFLCFYYPDFVLP
jgi:hypothetical protein